MDKETVIKVENVSKHYLISHENIKYDSNQINNDEDTGHVGFNFIKKIKNTLSSINSNKNKEIFHALDNINFEIKRGERVGIIGKNGAGKSTLLKILSRITHPSTGEVRICGRVSSLLEVGTGFHPELTGRENIFLNGAILGMSTDEIKRNFDEIVDFSGIGKFLDTPVKRYSSGMYVRLAFAVAAHLESDILIIDEVLAVGDAEFQKKCLGKIENMSNQGRTVLFVSHNMATISSLCQKAILLENGKIKGIGLTSKVIMSYYTNGLSSPSKISYERDSVGPGDEDVRLLGASIKDRNNKNVIEINISDPFFIEMEIKVLSIKESILVPNIYFYSSNGEIAFIAVDSTKKIKKSGIYISRLHIPENLLNAGYYFIGLAISSFEKGVHIHFFERNALSFNVYESIEDVDAKGGWVGPLQGAVRPLLNWETENKSSLKDYDLWSH